MNNPILEDGQGRTPEELEDSGWIILVAIIGTIAALIVSWIF